MWVSSIWGVLNCVKVEFDHASEKLAEGASTSSLGVKKDVLVAKGARGPLVSKHLREIFYSESICVAVETYPIHQLPIFEIF